MKMMEWIRTEDKLLEYGKFVIVLYLCNHAANPNGYSIISCEYFKEEWMVDHFCESFDIESVEFWQPFPFIAKKIDNV